jgi:hypothetical protein
VHDEREVVRVQVIDELLEPVRFALRVGRIAEEAERSCAGWNRRNSDAAREERENQGQTTFS